MFDLIFASQDFGPKVYETLRRVRNGIWAVALVAIEVDGKIEYCPVDQLINRLGPKYGQEFREFLRTQS